MKEHTFKVRCLKGDADYRPGHIYDAEIPKKFSKVAYAVRSEDGNIYLMRKDCFEVIDDPESITHVRS